MGLGEADLGALDWCSTDPSTDLRAANSQVLKPKQEEVQDKPLHRHFPSPPAAQGRMDTKGESHLRA